jgi:hypothetical protein
MLKKLTANSEELTKTELNNTKAGGWLTCMSYMIQTVEQCNIQFGSEAGRNQLHELCRASQGGLF